MEIFESYLDKNGVYQGPKVWPGNIEPPRLANRRLKNSDLERALKNRKLKAPLKSLGTLEVVQGFLEIEAPSLESLGNLKMVKDKMSIRNSLNLKSLGGVEHIGGDLLLFNCKSLSALGAFLFEEYSVELTKCPNLTSIAPLEAVGGSLVISGTPITEWGGMAEPRDNLKYERQIKGSLSISLGMKPPRCLRAGSLAIDAGAKLQMGGNLSTYMTILNFGVPEYIDMLLAVEKGPLSKMPLLLHSAPSYFKPMIIDRLKNGGGNRLNLGGKEKGGLVNLKAKWSMIYFADNRKRLKTDLSFSFKVIYLFEGELFLKYFEEYIDNNGVYLGPEVWKGNIGPDGIEGLVSLGTLETLDGCFIIGPKSLLTTLGSLKKITYNFILANNHKIENLGSLEYVGGNVSIKGSSKLTSLNNLAYVGGKLHLITLSSFKDYGALVKVVDTIVVSEQGLLPPASITFRDFAFAKYSNTFQALRKLPFKKYTKIMAKINKGSLTELSIMLPSARSGFRSLIEKRFRGV